MNCRKTGNQMKNIVCTQNNKRTERNQQGEEGDDHAILFETSGKLKKSDNNSDHSALTGQTN